MTPTMFAVTGNTYDKPYGEIICLFMITDNREEAEMHKVFLRDNHGIFAKITEVGLGVGTMAHLGGHIE